ncbi:26S proteasome non-ATPase regulatory subunit 12 [Tupaia chinensis]|uniref:26S proteasome non-ATPase regulatory subunit 12 n=1 Tax=Tupaia chinensis TaxID=246437 RepID=L9JFY9_TUPCH|nr:26S proteasome non-ATPase regulatory subunit 12 [Tupaia chinensis]
MLFIRIKATQRTWIFNWAPTFPVKNMMHEMSSKNEIRAGRKKVEVDYSTTVDQWLPKYEKLAKEGRPQEVIKTLVSLEKQIRTTSDMVSTSGILVVVVKMCYEAKEWDLLNENIMLLSKRRSLLKQAVVKMVQQCCIYVEEITDLSVKLRLSDTLQMVTEGKTDVEIECARLTKALANIKEQNGDKKEATSILQELQVETCELIEKEK